MHLADAFIQSDLHCVQVSTFLSALAFPGNRTHDLGVANAMLYQLSYRKAIIIRLTADKSLALTQHINADNGPPLIYIYIYVCMYVYVYMYVFLFKDMIYNCSI